MGWSGCLAGWASVSLVWERKLLSLSLTQELSLSASQLTGLRFDFCLGKEMIYNISSKAAPAVFVRWITMEDIFFFFFKLGFFHV